MLRKSSVFYLRSFAREKLPYLRKRGLDNERRSNQKNLGLLQPHERGDSFTEVGVYKSKSLDKYQAVEKRLKAVLSEQEKNALVHRYGVTDSRLKALSFSSSPEAAPQTCEEKKVISLLDEDELGLGVPVNARPLNSRRSAEATGREKQEDRKDVRRGEAQEYSTQLHRLRLQKTQESDFERQNRVGVAYNIEPTAKEVKRLLSYLAATNEEDATIEKIQKRLIDDHGIYPAQRMDAFMLGDETVFPLWVHKLGSRLRDKIKYGHMRLTEDDEALRIRLMRIPLDARKAEWQRLKKAKQYAMGLKEQTITVDELNTIKMGTKKNYWLLHRRQGRANAIRRLALRQPTEAALVPSQRVDFSARIATVARCVANGVETNGQWPVNGEALRRAKIKRDFLQSERIFLKTAEEKSLEKGRHASIFDALKLLDNEKIKPQKWYTRRLYAVRVNNVAGGVADEKGRYYKDIYRWMKVNDRAVTTGQKERERNLRYEPTPYASSRTPQQAWKVDRTPF